MFVPYHPDSNGTLTNVINIHPNILCAVLRKYTVYGLIYDWSFDILHIAPDNNKNGSVRYRIKPHVWWNIDCKIIDGPYVTIIIIGPIAIRKDAHDIHNMWINMPYR